MTSELQEHIMEENAVFRKALPERSFASSSP
jgi:hypothetical protein